MSNEFSGNLSDLEFGVTMDELNDIRWKYDLEYPFYASWVDPDEYQDRIKLERL